MTTAGDDQRQWLSVALTTHVTKALAERVDVARGSLSRSAFLEQAVLAFLESGATLTAVTRDAEQASRLRSAIRGTPEVMERLKAARSRPLPVRCAHRKRGGYCEKCRSLIDPDGYPVRAP